QADRTIHLRSGAIVSISRNAAAPALAPVPVSLTGPGTDAPFEPAPPTLTPVEPTPPGAGLGRFLVGFIGWALVFACAMYVLDRASARLQRQTIVAQTARRKQAETLALQQLRADIHDVSSRPDGGYELSIYLENFRPDQPVHVLGPQLRVFVQNNQS